MTENIVKFPNKTEEIFPSSYEEAMERITEIRTEYCDSVAEDAFDVVMQVLSSYNMFPRTNEDHIKDIVFLEEAIKAVVYRYKKLPHDFHKIAEDVVNISEEAQQEIDRIKQKEKIMVD